MSDLFAAVRDAVSVPAAAERCGLEADRAGMARCPFHNDRTPSLKLYEDHFHCFGCGKHGDCIDLAAALTGLTAYDAAKVLARTFGVDARSAAPRPSRPPLRRFRDDQARCQRTLCAYLRLLRHWRERYAPAGPDELPDGRFVEACQMIDTVDHLTDLLVDGSLEQRLGIVEQLLGSGLIDRLERRLMELETE